MWDGTFWIANLMSHVIYIQKGWSCVRTSHNRFYGRVVCLASIRFCVKNSGKGNLSQYCPEMGVSCGAFHFAGVGRIHVPGFARAC